MEIEQLKDLVEFLRKCNVTYYKDQYVELQLGADPNTNAEATPQISERRDPHEEKRAALMQKLPSEYGKLFG